MDSPLCIVCVAEPIWVSLFVVLRVCIIITTLSWHTFKLYHFFSFLLTGIWSLQETCTDFITKRERSKWTIKTFSCIKHILKYNWRLKCITEKEFQTWGRLLWNVIDYFTILMIKLQLNLVRSNLVYSKFQLCRNFSEVPF
jgi:hypothetical protein